MKSEVRQFRRSPRHAGVDINSFSGQTADLSEGGFCAEVKAFFKPGSTVYGRIHWGGRRFDYTGQVMWAATHRVGVRFLGVEHDFLEQLRG